MTKLYIFLLSAVFLGFTIVFNTFPRSTYSELEKRELATFPQFTWKKLWSGDFTAEISSWFSDSEPYRDEFLSLSMEVDNRMRLALSDDNVTFHAPTTPVDYEEEEEEEDNTSATDSTANPGSTATADSIAAAPKKNPLANENAKIANAGIIIVGTGERVRALMLYHGRENMGGAYAELANTYKETFGDSVNVYSMAIPTAVEFYCPDKVKRQTRRQRPTLDNILAHLSPSVRAVDAYGVLSRHIDEPIYLRTDHHWSPLGAYYVAEEFARVAGVPFRNLSFYTQKVTHQFVGSMYAYSNDIAVKNAPEDFIYYVPDSVDYSTTYVNFDVNADYQVTGESRPYKSKYFFHYRDGNSGAYSTFMGSDMKLTKVTTSTANGRRVLIIKDSFGNAIPGYLFYSFEEVHVVDFRYFTRNMREFVADNRITDILFAYNMFNACSKSASRKPLQYLTQQGGIKARPRTENRQDTIRTDTLRTDTLQNNNLQ